MQDMFNKVLDCFRGTVENDAAELRALATQVGEKVHNFIVDHDWGFKGQNGLVPSEAVSLESLTTDTGQEWHGQIESLVAEAKVPEPLRATACEQLAMLAFKFFNKNTGGREGAFGMHVQPSENTQGISGLDSVFSPAMAQQFEAAYESFGQFTDLPTLDIQAAMTVALMRAHMGLMPRMCPTRVTPTPTVSYKVPRVTVFDLADPTADPTPMIHLFEDPSVVSNDLPDLVPLNDNDDDDLYIVDDVDGLMKFNVEVPMLDLSIDSSKVGYDKVNHTDIVADGAKLSRIRVGITVTNRAAEEVDESFDLAIPADMCRLTRVADSHDSADRQLTFRKEYFIVGGASATATIAGVDNTICDDAANANEGLKVVVQASVSLNLKSGKVTAFGTASVSGHQVAGDDLSVDWALTAATAEITLTGYSLDAKHSEQNMRRTSIAVRQDTRQFSYNLPIGRNYVADRALGQTAADSVASSLTRIVDLGEDHIALSLVLNTLDSVYDRLSEADAQGLDNVAVAHNYAAGYQVKPMVYTDTFDILTLNARQDGDRTGDIKQRALSYLNSITTRLQSGSYIREQIAKGESVVYRLATTIKILGCVLGQEHIHNLLEKGERGSDGSGVEYRITLPNGVILEVVTTNFSMLEDKMVLVPFIKNDPKSILNFGTIWDMGTLVGHVNMTSRDGAWNRMYANARQAFIPTCPVGAVIDITNAYEVNENDLSA